MGDATDDDAVTVNLESVSTELEPVPDTGRPIESETEILLFLHNNLTELGSEFFESKI